MGLQHVVEGFVSSWRRDARESLRLKILLGVAGLLVVCSALYLLGSARRAPERADVAKMDFVFKCSQCGKPVEMSGQDVLTERARLIEKDIKAGGKGYPELVFPCPHCGGRLAKAERTADGEVRVPAVAPGQKPPMADAFTAGPSGAAAKPAPQPTNGSVKK